MRERKMEREAERDTLSITSTWMVSLTQTTTQIAKKIKKVTKRTNFILDYLSTEYTQQAFTHASWIFHRMCSLQARKVAWLW